MPNSFTNYGGGECECEWAEKRNSFRRRKLLAGACQASERPVSVAVRILYLSGVFAGTNSFSPLVKNWHRCVCSLWLYYLEYLPSFSNILSLAKPIFSHWTLPLRPAVKSLFTHSFISVVWMFIVLGDFTLYWGHFLLCMWLSWKAISLRAGITSALVIHINRRRKPNKHLLNGIRIVLCHLWYVTVSGNLKCSSGQPLKET